MGWNLAWSMVCDRGVTRSENQDATLVWDSARAAILPTAATGRDQANGAAVLSEGDSRCVALAAVADGMGGPPGGAQASQVIVHTIGAALPAGVVGDPRRFLAGLVEASDRAVYAAAERHGLVGMGSTCTLLMLAGDRVYLCHVGDSRCYRVHPLRGAIAQWSRDQNVAADLVEQGVLTAEEARHHRSSHTLTQAVGLGKTLEPQIDALPLGRAGEMFLLCSDGLLRVVEDPEILRTLMDRLAPEVAGDACERLTGAAVELVDLANRRGAPDNVSVVLLEISPH